MVFPLIRTFVLVLLFLGILLSKSACIFRTAPRESLVWKKKNVRGSGASACDFTGLEGAEMLCRKLPVMTVWAVRRERSVEPAAPPLLWLQTSDLFMMCEGKSALEFDLMAFRYHKVEWISLRRTDNLTGSCADEIKFLKDL